MILNFPKTKLADDCPWRLQGIKYYEDIPRFRIDYKKCSEKEYKAHIVKMTKLSWPWLNSKIFVKKIKLLRMMQDDKGLSQS